MDSIPKSTKQGNEKKVNRNGGYQRILIFRCVIPCVKDPKNFTKNFKLNTFSKVARHKTNTKY